jgi:hypothetical protein
MLKIPFTRMMVISFFSRCLLKCLELLSGYCTECSRDGTIELSAVFCIVSYISSRFIKYFGQELQKSIVGGFTRLLFMNISAISPPYDFCCSHKL